MGKKARGQRSKGRRGGGAGGGAGARGPTQQTHSGGVSGGFGGFFHPSFLAQQASAVKTTAPPTTQTSTKNAAKTSAQSSKKRKRQDDEEQKKSSSSKYSPDQSKKEHKRRLKQDEEDAYQPRSGDDDDDDDKKTERRRNCVQFGHVAWRRWEQLCHVISPLFPVGKVMGEGSADHRTKACVFVIFLGQRAPTDDLAMWKPILHPSPCWACHKKMKKEHLLEGMARIFDVATSFHMAQDDDSDENDDAIPAPALFVKDDGLDTVMAACKSLAKKKPRTSRPGAKVSSNLAVVGVHGTVSPLMERRQGALQSVSRLLNPNNKKSDSSCHVLNVALDGIPEEGHHDKEDDTGRRASLFPTSIQHLIPSSDRLVVQQVIRAAKVLHQASMPSTRPSCSVHDDDDVECMESGTVTTRSDGKSQATRVARAHLVPALHILRSPAKDIGNLSLVRKKMKILGMISAEEDVDSNSGTNAAREAARTQWLDGALGETYGAAWSGRVRFGASGDQSSRELARIVHTVKKAQSEKQTDATLKMWGALSRWNPNPFCGPALKDDDEEEDQGLVDQDFGDWPCSKACGHNETTMFYIRPFAPLQVLNSRVCSQRSPAPGNVGYEGCLEFLRRLCAKHKRSMTFWDSECFAVIDGSRPLAPVKRLLKRHLLSFSCDQLAWLMEAMREWTLHRHASCDCVAHPRDLLGGILAALNLVCGTQNVVEFPTALPPSVLRRIGAHVLPGNVKRWKRLQNEFANKRI